MLICVDAPDVAVVHALRLVDPRREQLWRDLRGRFGHVRGMWWRFARGLHMAVSLCQGPRSPGHWGWPRLV